MTNGEIKEEKTIAVIEDNNELRSVLTDILEDEGYTVVAAAQPVVSRSDGQDVFEKKPDVFLIDAWLNGENSGLREAEAIYSSSLYSQAPVILLSSDHEIAREIDPKHVYTFIPKPFQIAHLLEAIATALLSTAK